MRGGRLRRTKSTSSPLPSSPNHEGSCSGTGVPDIDGEAERTETIVTETYPSEPSSPLNSSTTTTATAPCPPNQDASLPQKVFWNPPASSNLCGGLEWAISPWVLMFPNPSECVYLERDLFPSCQSEFLRAISYGWADGYTRCLFLLSRDWCVCGSANWQSSCCLSRTVGTRGNVFEWQFDDMFPLLRLALPPLLF